MPGLLRDRQTLTVSDGPGAAYRSATALSVLSFCAAVPFAVMAAQGETGPVAPVLWVAILGLFSLTLIRGFRTRQFQFDSSAGTLVVAERGLLRRLGQRSVSLAKVAALIDRRSSGERSVELLLEDRSSLVVARAKPRSRVLDEILLALGDFLKTPPRLTESLIIDGRFEVLDWVAQGGMGVVYRARDRENDGLVALKLSLDRQEDAAHQQRFLREMQLLATLDHPRICRHVHHGTTSDGRAYLAMEWLSGEDLRVTLARRSLSLEESLAVVVGAAEALSFVHARGVVHRDMKPGNLFLRDRSPGDTLLLDFGLARLLDGATRLTQSRTIVGTPHYISPEQASGSGVATATSDVFSLGCIFYECVTGKPPFDAPYLVGVLARILLDTPESVRELCPEIPEEWAELIDRLLSKDPARRPKDGAALLVELRRLPSVGSGAAAIASGSGAGERSSLDQILVSVVLATLREVALSPSHVADRFDSAREALSRFGCPIEHLADGSLLATVLPRQSATDQARIAARCALSLRELLPDAVISVATGRAPLGRAPKVGEAVDRAVVLLESEAPRDAIRVDAVTRGLLDGHFALGKRQSGAVDVLEGERQALDESRLLLGKPTPCVGRELELVQLEGVVSSSIEESVPRAVVVLGAPGIGKSRIRHEFSRRMRARFPELVELVGYGDPLSAGSPYVLLADALTRYAGIRAGAAVDEARAAIVERLCADVDVEHRKRVSEFLGELCGVHFPSEGSIPLQAARADHRVMSEQITMAFVDWLSATCRKRPLAIVLEDVQWADALTLKLLDTASTDLLAVPLTVLSFGRPEARELFPNLAFGNALFVNLGPLSAKASEALILGVLGRSVDSEPLKRIVRLASGNALFLEELIRAAAEGKAGDVPETVLAILQARLSRLAPELRLSLRAASVFGEHFWRTGVERIAEAWGAARDHSQCLAQLMAAELIEERRTSRLGGEHEYFFRHALVCDAAYALVSDEDRRTGHAAAGEFLEASGETDGAVLARHAEGAGEKQRAIQFLTRAAEQSLEQYDFGEALTRAQKAVDAGASGSTLGVLLGIESSAYYSLGRFPDSAEAGLRALDLVPFAGRWWCAVVEKLLQVLPNTDQLMKSRELSDTLHRIDPGPEARSAYLRALHAQLLGDSVSAAHQRGQRTFDFLAKLGPEVAEPDVATRGYARLWRAVFSSILGRDVSLSLQLCDEAVRDLSESQVLYRLALAYIVRSFAYWSAGQLDKSEEAARKGKAIATQIRDDYHRALAAWYLSLPLADQNDPAKLAAAEHEAKVMTMGGDNPLFDAVARIVLARIALARGDFVAAEREGKLGRTGLMNMPPYGLMSSAYVLDSLVAQGKLTEAVEIARHDLAALRALEGPLVTEVLFLVSATEALFAASELDEARSALDDALTRMTLRRATIREADRALFDARHENVRALALRAQLGS